MSKGTEDSIARTRTGPRVADPAPTQHAAPPDGRSPRPAPCSPTIELFFRDAFKRLGGRISRREQAATRSPTCRPPSAPGNARRCPPTATRYERATFGTRLRRRRRRPPRRTSRPGHPLPMDTVPTPPSNSPRCPLEAGTLLFDPTDPGTEPRLIGADRRDRRRHREQWYPNTSSPSPHLHRRAMTTGPAPTLTCTPCPNRPDPRPNPALTSAWLTTGVEQLATSWAVTTPNRNTSNRSATNSCR